MKNPLDEHIEAFQTARDAIKVARRVVDQRPNPVSNTGFYGRTADEAHEMLDRVEEQLDKLVAFALFATFERSLRNHLSASLEPVASSTTVPKELASNLHEFLESGVDNWRIDSVIELYNPPAIDQDVNNAKGIRTYRHHVAHGAAPPVSIPPQTVYSQLSDFLKNAGLVS
jgi:hypothetical protein